MLRRISDIRQCLREGLHPLQFGAQEIGDGGQRTAYLIGNYVIKQRAPAWQHDSECDDPVPCPARRAYDVPRAALARAGVNPPQQWTTGSWVIQPYYRPMTTNERSTWKFLDTIKIFWTPTRRIANRVKLDVHRNNVGVHPVKGTIHAYDW